MHVLIELWKRRMAWAIKRHFMQSSSFNASFLDGPSRPSWYSLAYFSMNYML